MSEPAGPIQFRLDARQEEVVTGDGRTLHGEGYVLCDIQSGEELGPEDFYFRIGGGIVCEVAGLDAHIAELQSPGFAPGSTVLLVRTNLRGAIEVTDPETHEVCGEIPDDVVEAISMYGADAYTVGLLLWEWRTSEGRRVALRVLLAPGWRTDPA